MATFDTTSTPNRIDLICPNARHEEAKATAIVKPGHLLKPGAAQTCAKDDGSPQGKLWIAKEDALQGKSISDAYAVGDLVMCHVIETGDRVLGRVAPLAPAIADGDGLARAGDGTVIKALTPSGQVYNSVAASAAVTNDAAETAFDKSYQFGANQLKVGDQIRVRAQAIPTATNATNTLNLKLKIGTTIICATGAVDVANSDVGYIEAVLTIRSIGATGKFVANGSTSLGVPGTVTAKPFFLGETTVDTTAAQTITVTATWSVADPGNSVRLDALTIDLIRAAANEALGKVEFLAKEACDQHAEETDDAFIRMEKVA